MFQRGNLLHLADPPAEGERMDTLLDHGPLLIERIVSSSRIAGQEYRQPQDEWVVLLKGNATLEVEGISMALCSGDYVFLASGTPHRVAQVSEGAIWLAVHLHRAVDGASSGDR
ncbi:cupin domain-containing protein [Pseudomarimonas arenosa]|uniref:Cupin domain-containing protein n=1 Tax=Pseudomarimonas arenosa TaxID=2774145 RepID=A0AAW3ZNH0_9GAMM|nr:cupin domain-containing protein [Pseudomarimonas arenosa]MBD8526719.1 cupin domain-containing protein [Pseudomarimonas arenosa]